MFKKWLKVFWSEFGFSFAVNALIWALIFAAGVFSRENNNFGVLCFFFGMTVQASITQALMAWSEAKSSDE